MTALAFIASPIGRAVAVFAVILGLFGWAQMERAGRHAAQADLAKAREVIAGRDRAIEALQARMAERADQANRQQVIIRRINAAPSSRACADSGPVRALLDGLRADGAGGAGAAGAAVLPAGAPAPAR